MVTWKASGELQNQQLVLLVGGFNPLEKYWWIWIIFPGRGENKNCLKPPLRLCTSREIRHWVALSLKQPQTYFSWLSLPFNTHLLRYWYLMPEHHMSHQKKPTRSESPMILVHESWWSHQNDYTPIQEVESIQNALCSEYIYLHFSTKCGNFCWPISVHGASGFGETFSSLHSKVVSTHRTGTHP